MAKESIVDRLEEVMMKVKGLKGLNDKPEVKKKDCPKEKKYNLAKIEDMYKPTLFNVPQS